MLKPGATVAQAQQELATVARRLETTEHPDTNRGWGVRVLAFRDQVVDRSGRVLVTLLLGSVGLVLLIGCFNLASLLLARGAARQREMAVRAALGAGRGDLVRHLLAEAALLAAAGGALGILAGGMGLDLLVASFPEDLPYWMRLDLDGPLLAFTATVSVATAVACGLVPAVRASRPDLVGDLQENGRAGGSRRQSRIPQSLVVGQVALSRGFSWERTFWSGAS